MNKLTNGPMTGKTVLVNGASGGISLATALALSKLGAHVAITGRDRASVLAATRAIRSAGGGPADVFLADLSSHVEVRRLAAEVLELLPRLDALVNNVSGGSNARGCCL